MVVTESETTRRITTRVIVAVDDNASVRRIIHRALGGRYAVLLASSAQEAMRFLQDFRVDLVITDIVMPETNGLDLADQVSRAFPHVPVAFLSGYLNDDLISSASSRSPFVISKPFEVVQLQASVEAILRGVTPTRAEPQPPLTVAPTEPQQAALRQNIQHSLAMATASWQFKRLTQQGKRFRVRMRDSSMSPTLLEGDLLEVAAITAADLRAGDYVYCRHHEAFVVRRFVRHTLQSDYPHLVLHGEMGELVVPLSHLIGRIAQVERDGQVLPLSTRDGFLRRLLRLLRKNVE